MVKRFLLYLFILLLINTYLSADIGSDDFNIEIFPGFNTFYTLNSWMPLVVLVDTKLDSFSGKITVKLPYGDIYTGSDLFYLVSRDLFLTKGQQKVFQFTLPVVRSGVIEVSVYKEGKLIFTLNNELSTTHSKSHQLLIPGNSTDFDFLRQYSPESNNKYQTNNIHIDHLPETSAGYSSINSVIIHDTNLNVLSESHLNALVNWIRNGGNFFVTGSISHSGDLPNFISDILPVRIIGPVISNLSSSEWFKDISPKENIYLPVIRTRVRTGSKVILEAGGVPIIISREEGYGNIFYISLNPGDSNYINWINREAFWDFVFSLEKSEHDFFPVSNPLPKLNESLISEIPLDDSFKNSIIIYIIMPLIILLIIILIKKIQGRIFIFTILVYPVIWSLLIILFFKIPSPSYFETEIINSRLNNKHGHLFVTGTFAVYDPGMYNLKFSSAPDLILPGYDQNLSINYSELNSQINILMDPWSKQTFFMTTGYLADFSGLVKKKGNSIIIEIISSDPTKLLNPIISYKNKLTDEFILLNEKNKLVLSFDILKKRSEYEMDTSNYPKYFDNFLSYLKEANFLRSISDDESIVLIMEIDNFIPFTNIETGIIRNKTFLVLEIPLKEFLYEN